MWKHVKWSSPGWRWYLDLKENDRLQAWLVLRSTWMKMIVTSWILVRQNGYDCCQSHTSETIRTKCLHWGEVDHIQPLALKVDQKKVMILFSRLHWRSIGKRWSYSAACTEGWSLRKDMILFSCLHWRLTGKRWSYSAARTEGRFNGKEKWSYSAACTEGRSEKGDLIQPLTLKVDTLKVNPWG